MSKNIFKPHFVQNNQYEVISNTGEIIKAYGVTEAQAKLSVYSNKPGVVIARVKKVN